jgi:hypothetical protein
MLTMLFSVGCMSRTKVQLGPLMVGGQTELHEFRQPSVTFGLDKVGFTLGHVSAFVKSAWGKCTKALDLETTTGPTGTVGSNGIADLD